MTLCAPRVEAVHGFPRLLGAAELRSLSLPERLAFIGRSLLSHSNWYSLELPGLL
eukprot:SAG11_NODE_6974_length_1216_cov_1.329454_1_plen_54_part_01